MLLASNLINVENVYLNFVSIRILLPSGSRSTIFLLFRISWLRTLLRYFFGFLQIISFQHNQIILITLLRDDLDESCLFDSSFFSRRNKKSLLIFLTVHFDCRKKSRCYWSVRLLLSVDYANMWRTLTKLSLFWQTFDSKLSWLKKGRNEIDKNMSQSGRRNLLRFQWFWSLKVHESCVAYVNQKTHQFHVEIDNYVKPLQEIPMRTQHNILFIYISKNISQLFTKAFV